MLQKWHDQRSINTEYENAEEWLNKDNWSNLNNKLVALKKSDSVAETKNIQTIGFDAWTYFRSGFFDKKDNDYSKEISNGESLVNSFQAHKNNVLEKGLNKYVDIFSIIGFVLLGFSLLIALLSKPLNKLMHGVQ